MEVLKGHTSEETAYMVDDYPYGFRLRCKIRYWLEKTKHGVRFCSQTTNPKKAFEVWNAPKKSTYSDVGCMYKDDNGHVHWSGISMLYANSKQLGEFLARFSDGLDVREIGELEKLRKGLEVRGL